MTEHEEARAELAQYDDMAPGLHSGVSDRLADSLRRLLDTSEQETAMYDQPSGVSREELIEKAAEAMYAVAFGYEPLAIEPDDKVYWTDFARAALVVFEEAHTANVSEPRKTDERKALIAELRWLAEARKEYETDVFPSIAREVQTARQLADILERKTPVTEGGHGFGWIPSWRWDEWDQMTPRTVQAEPSAAQVDAAMDAVKAFYAEHGIELMPEEVDLGAMRVALRAAAAVQGGETR